MNSFIEGFSIVFGNNFWEVIGAFAGIGLFLVLVIAGVAGITYLVCRFAS